MFIKRGIDREGGSECGERDDENEKGNEIKRLGGSEKTR